MWSSISFGTGKRAILFFSTKFLIRKRAFYEIFWFSEQLRADFPDPVAPTNVIKL
jgi:hypothetical protein